MSDRVITSAAKDGETTDEKTEGAEESADTDKANAEEEPSSDSNVDTTSESKRMSLKELEVLKPLQFSRLIAFRFF